MRWCCVEFVEGTRFGRILDREVDSTRWVLFSTDGVKMERLIERDG